MVTAAWRRALICSLFFAPVILLGSGCKTSSGWLAPWAGWGGASSPSATALNISKPSTQAPAPITTPGQQNRALAARGGANAPGANAAGPGAVNPANAVTAYPATPQAHDYPAQPAGTWQPGAAAGGQVAPVGGLQVGPYGMQSNPPASGYAGNAQPRGPAAGAPGYGGAPRGNAPDASPAAEGPYGGREDYRTADQGAASRSRGGAANGGAAPAESPEASSSIYGGGEGAAAATEPSVYGPTQETSPAAAGNAPAAGPYSNTEAPAESASPRSYGPPNTVAPSATRPSTSPPPSSGTSRPALPQSLSNSGGYRPGSTSGGYGTRNADYEQPQNAAVPENAPADGTRWR